MEIKTVPITEDIYQLLIEKGAKYSNLFESSMRVAFQEALTRANIILPDGQNTHVLRHTFASHFIMQGGDLITLQKILGHETLDMVLRYAHLAPNHLEQARTKHPLVVPRP